jgi:DNA-binding MarR family transcriptional regulator
MCDRLVRKGLVVRRHDRGDRRLIRLTLARKGHDLVAAVTERRRTEIAQLLEAIPAEQQGVLVDALGFLTAAAGEVPEQDWSTGWDL